MAEMGFCDFTKKFSSVWEAVVAGSNLKSKDCPFEVEEFIVDNFLFNGDTVPAIFEGQYLLKSDIIHVPSKAIGNIQSYVKIRTVY